MKTTGTPPDALNLFRAMRGMPYRFFLDSSLAGGRLGRWSFLGGDPFLVFRSKGRRVRLEWRAGRRESFDGDPFTVLGGLFHRFRRKPDPSGVPFTSGAAGYFAYDLKDRIEALPDLADDDLGLPDCVLGFYDSVTAVDHAKGTVWTADGRLPGRAVREEAILPEAGGGVDPAAIRSNFTRASYKAAIARAKEYIRKGDIYQVNLSQRFEVPFDGDPPSLYERLRRVNPAPFSSFFEFGEAVTLSSSPERFLKMTGSSIETRPIKGTRPRGDSRAEDMRLARELVDSAKDRAEHVMIVDLERNDLGKVCDYGTVRPAEFIALERYARVFHLVSTVSGTLREGATPVDCLLAAFPGGSITGAPKVRSMEVIEELEPVKRSVYTGAIGYIDFGGAMDTSIVIRTFVLKGERLYFQAGGGIVADSDPDAEYDETLHKARALFESLSGQSEGQRLFKEVGRFAG